MMIYVGESHLHFSVEFGSLCTRSSVDSLNSAVFRVMFSSGTCEQQQVSDSNRCLYEGLVGWINT
jgi:hypothetical protein